MIRNVVLVKLKAGQDPAVIAEAQQAFLDLNCPGTLSYVIGDDLGLREGNWSFAIVADFTDTEAYRAYDQDPAHNHARAGLIPLTSRSPGSSSRCPDGHPGTGRFYLMTWMSQRARGEANLADWSAWALVQRRAIRCCAPRPQGPEIRARSARTVNHASSASSISTMNASSPGSG